MKVKSYSIAISVITLFFLLILPSATSQSHERAVGINTQSPDSSAILHIESLTKGVLFPRLTNLQRDAILNPAQGLFIYNMDRNCLNYWTGYEWLELCGLVPPCIPDCLGLECGDDGCGSSCGSCPPGETCDNGVCIPICQPDCAGKECGDDGCGGLCGSCPPGETCDNGVCVPICQPDCAGKECGDDGCGGSCGACSSNLSCYLGQCECIYQDEVDCPGTFISSTIGLANNYSSYPCQAWDESGPEHIYLYIASFTGSVTASLSSIPDLDIFILESCSPVTCVASGDDTTTFQVVSGQSYFIVIDGYEGAQGNFTLTLTCQ